MGATIASIRRGVDGEAGLGLRWSPMSGQPAKLGLRQRGTARHGGHGRPPPFSARYGFAYAEQKL